jgi:hypothetical protein
MSTIAAAWDAFMRAPEEVRDLQERGGTSANEPTELLRHARELLDIIEAESAEQSISIPSDARAVLAQLRGRLQSLEKDVLPTTH